MDNTETAKMYVAWGKFQETAEFKHLATLVGKENIRSLSAAFGFGYDARTEDMTLGATGDFPRGKFNNADEGELRLAVGLKDKTVIIDFGKSVAWIGMDREKANAIGRAIIEKAAEIGS